MRHITIGIFLFLLFTVPALAQTPDPDNIDIQPYDYESGSEVSGLNDLVASIFSDSFLSVFGSVAATVMWMIKDAAIGGDSMLLALVLLILGLLAIKWMYGRITGSPVGDLPGNVYNLGDQVDVAGGAAANTDGTDNTIVYNNNPYRVVHTNDNNVKIIKRYR